MIMAAGKTIQGRRLSDAVFGKPGAGWSEWKKQEPGSYLKVCSTDDPGAVSQQSVWHVTLPSGIQFTLGANHMVTEHRDGTITASPPMYDAPNGWHGFLERGIWREV